MHEVLIVDDHVMARDALLGMVEHAGSGRLLSKPVTYPALTEAIGRIIGPP